MKRKSKQKIQEGFKHTEAMIKFERDVRNIYLLTPYLLIVFITKYIKNVDYVVIFLIICLRVLF